MGTSKKIVVIGGGASGMMAAGMAGSRGLDVTLIEKNRLPGRKIMITGKGRCNLTNDTDAEGLLAGVPVNGKFLYSAFNSFSSKDLIRFFKALGLETKTERGRRVFPASDSASSVVDALRKHLVVNKVKMLKNEVTGVFTGDDKVAGVFLKDGTKIYADSVIIATGGISYALTGSTGDGYGFAKKLGHNISPLKPSLVPIETKEHWVPGLQGLSLRNVSLKVIEGKGKEIFDDFGEMLFTHFGVSGPLVLSASSFMRNIENKKYTLLIDLKPSLSEKQLDMRIQRDFSEVSRKIFSNSLNALLPKKLIPVIIEISKIPPDKPVNQLTKKEREELGCLLKSLPVTAKRFRPVDEAIITSGGVSTREINPSTMESKKIGNLFFAGEVIDVDGYTGGFNLQIAFSTGYLAGMNA